MTASADQGSAAGDLGLTSEELEQVGAYLERGYRGVFGQAEIDWHLQAHVGFPFADYAVEVLRPSVPEGARVLDLGAGFGSFVLRARAAGWDATGIERSVFEVDLARRRLRRLRPEDDADRVFLEGDILGLEVDKGTIDAVTVWNVIEHIEDQGRVLQMVESMLRPGGLVFILCPNYLAWRREAHYQVPWYPWLAVVPRSWVSGHLRRHGKDPAFFEHEIHRRTNWGVQGTLRQLGMELYDFSGYLPLGWRNRRLLRQLRYLPRVASLLNPFRGSVEVLARKPG